MKYMLLIHQGTTPTSPSDEWDRLPEDEKKAVYRDYQAINETLGVTPGQHLQPPATATTVRVDDGRTLTTDGPFVEPKEPIGGYFLLKKVDDLDRAIELASRVPAARMGGAVEVRPVVERLIERVFQDEWGRVLAALIGFLGDFDRAEEAAQEAFAIAAERWPRDGVPANPGAWLLRTARNRAIDRIRRERTLAAKSKLLKKCPETVMEDEMEETAFPDERLELIFTCCHPSLATDAQVALTLRTLGGLSTEQIARAFLVAEATMAQRLVRAKRKIKAAGIPFRIPPSHLLPDRVAAVLAVVYVIIYEGYDGRGELARREAIRLGHALVELMPDEPEVSGLLALMAVARRPAHGPLPRRGAHPAQRPGQIAMGPRPDRGRPRSARSRPRIARPRPLRAAGRDRLAARGRHARLVADCRPLW